MKEKKEQIISVRNEKGDIANTPETPKNNKKRGQLLLTGEFHIIYTDN